MIYVDDARIPFGRMKMSHMLADTTEELLDMATRIGLDHKHLQHAGLVNEHFDVSSGKRDHAIQLGAMPVTKRELVKLIRKKRAMIGKPAPDLAPPAPGEPPALNPTGPLMYPRGQEPLATFEGVMQADTNYTEHDPEDSL